jgi:peptide methionine sulfoxide reductase MsrA
MKSLSQQEAYYRQTLWAEDYHQDYYTKNPLRYKYYRYSLRPRSAARSALGTHCEVIIQIAA